MTFYYLEDCVKIVIFPFLKIGRKQYQKYNRLRHINK